jgi:hypothetical protein
MMSRYTEILQIPIEDVAVLADAYEGYAFSFGESFLGEKFLEIQPWRSSSLLLASIFRSLLSPRESRSLFRVAAINYRELGNPFWKTLAVCGLDQGLLLNEQVLPRGNSSEIDFSEIGNSSHFYNLLSQCWLSSFRDNQSQRAFERDLQQAQRKSFQKVGRLEIPMSLYTNVIVDSLEWRSPQPKIQNWRALLHRANESVELSRSDRFHWEKLPGSIVPFEPEILAACVSLGSRWLSMDHSLSELSERMNMQGSAKVPLLIAIELLEGASELNLGRM